MNNKERYIWIAAIIVAIMFFDRKTAQVERLQDLQKSYQLSSQVQSDQINELIISRDQHSSSQYSQGFEDGKSHAMIAVIHNDNLHDYAEGYHAAINQLSEELSNEELKKQVSSYIDKLVNNMHKEFEKKH
jgi:hypothetical protein